MGSQTYHCNKNSIIHKIALILKLYCPIRAPVLQASLLLCWCKCVGCFGNALELRLALKVEEDRGFFYVAAFKYSFDDFVAVERLACFCEDVSNNVGNGSFREAPVIEGVNAATNQYKALVLDKLIVNCLCRDVFS